MSPEEIKALRKINKEAKSEKAAKKAPISPKKKETAKGSKGKGQKKDTTTSNAGPGFAVLSEKTLFLGQTLAVIQGNIANIEVDAIVNPTNGNFSLSGEVGKYLQNLTSFYSVTNVL